MVEFIDLELAFMDVVNYFGSVYICEKWIISAQNKNELVIFYSIILEKFGPTCFYDLNTPKIISKKKIGYGFSFWPKTKGILS